VIGWTFPYPSQRMPVIARNVVATSQPLAVAAGLDALRDGGNAVDAALATAITLTVVEPNNNGVGSDAFAIVGRGNDVWGLNGSGRAPAGWTSARFAGRKTMPNLGWDSVTVPGAVSAWVALSERFGKLPFHRLFDAAIAYAADGFHVGPLTAHYWHLATTGYNQFGSAFPDFGQHFLIDGRAPRAGELFRRPDLARTLTQIAQSRGEAFYRGELAQRIASAAAAAGGAMNQDDLAAHRADWVTPIKQSYRGVELHEIPPNGQGLAAQIALAILQHFDLPALGPDAERSIHLQIEAMKIAIRAAFEHFADPRAMRVTPEELLGAASLQSLAGSIDAKAARLPPVRLPVSHDTVYLTAADADGMMVSMIQSNYRGFGSGIVIPGTGISMQNRGSGFVLDPAHPNCVGPNKRPYHTIIPGFVTERGLARMSFGVMGGHMQHQGHVQMINRVFDCRQNPQAASDAPRWHVFEDYSVGLETGFPTAIADALAARGHAVRYEAPALFGGAQLIYRLQDGYCGASDHRKEGLAAGY
jgi:gamma-glutamyltranspeptidase / glutathione hydrolase